MGQCHHLDSQLCCKPDHPVNPAKFPVKLDNPAKFPVKECQDKALSLNHKEYQDKMLNPSKDQSLPNQYQYKDQLLPNQYQCKDQLLLRPNQYH